ncbi:MFS transporter [Luteimonas sp. MC1750]|uniref:MFS transporter n=1 Tax=Luteimonas sp. MC1750 TaxID=2799326 RepID=UPI0018F0FEB6|nr:MFS transporter [Luteimonas sp. MC1750]MBJ6984284.1 MFS transporter [Luteimonas sp. MC1750]QQO05091.1 MFS transporter [Luteimonas sp. MC1750]
MPAFPTPAGGPRVPGRLLALAGIALAAFNLRTAVTSITPLLDVVGREFGFGAAMAGVIGMLPAAAFAAFGAATPAIARRLGLERTVLLAMALAAAGLVLRSLAGGVGVLIAGSLVSLAGMGIGNVVLPPLVKRWFPHRVGTLSVVYITALQAGTILAALLAVPLADAFGWRLSMAAWTLAAIAAALPWVLLLRRVPGAGSGTGHDRGRDAGAAGIPAAGATDLASTPGTRNRVWHTGLGWGMALMFGMTSLATYAMFTWMPRIFTEAGASPAFGGAMVALYTGFSLLGGLVVPALAVRMRNSFPMALACALAQFAGFYGLWQAPMAAPWLWATLVGIGGCTFPLGLTLINLRTRTPDGSAALSGFTQGLGYTLACLGPLLFGILREATGGFAWPFAMLAASVVVMLGGAWQACRPRVLEDGPGRGTTRDEAAARQP